MGHRRSIGEGWMLERIAGVQYQQGNAEEARKTLDKALEIARDNSDSRLLAACEQALSTHS